MEILEAKLVELQQKSTEIDEQRKIVLEEISVIKKQKCQLLRQEKLVVYTIHGKYEAKKEIYRSYTMNHGYYTSKELALKYCPSQGSYTGRHTASYTVRAEATENLTDDEILKIDQPPNYCRSP